MCVHTGSPRAASHLLPQDWPGYLLDACYVLLNFELNKIKQVSDLQDLSETSTLKCSLGREP